MLKASAPCGKFNPASEQIHFFWKREGSHHGFCSSKCLSLKCVLSVAGESPACPTTPFSYQFWRLLLCLHTASPLHRHLHSHHGAHSPLGNLPVAIVCKWGQLEIRGGKRCLWIFPQIRKPFPPLGACHTQCYSSELALPLLNGSTCSRGGTRGNWVSASLWQPHLGLDLGCSPPFHRHLLLGPHLQCRAAVCLWTPETLTKGSGEWGVTHSPLD